MSELGKRAEALFRERHSCGESVVLAATGDPALMSMATALGAGMVRQGEMCGAVAAGLLLIGRSVGRTSPAEREKYEEVMARGQTYLRRVEERLGALRCQDLTGYTLDSPERLAAFYQDPQRREGCTARVAIAAELLEKMLAEGQIDPSSS